MKKALILFSGGLDSILASKVLELQKIKVEGICFSSPFFGCENAIKSAKEINMPLHIVDISSEILKIVKEPDHGYGKNMNPCLDCHAFMIKKAKEFLKKEKYDFIATGEVLGQRPFSQNKQALKNIEKIANIEVLRPLSAKLLPETEIEKKGFVKRGLLKKISGRSREKQEELIKKFNIKNYPSPAGGCLLTDPEFSQRIIKMLDYWPNCSPRDINLLKNGRIFWLNYHKKKILLVVGRNKDENKNLKKLAIENDFMLELEEINGPLSILRGFKEKEKIKEIEEIKIPEILMLNKINFSEKKEKKEIIKIAELLTGWYTTKARNKNVKMKIINK